MEPLRVKHLVETRQLKWSWREAYTVTLLITSLSLLFFLPSSFSPGLDFHSLEVSLLSLQKPDSFVSHRRDIQRKPNGNILTKVHKEIIAFSSHTCPQLLLPFLLLLLFISPKERQTFLYTHHLNRRERERQRQNRTETSSCLTRFDSHSFARRLCFASRWRERMMMKEEGDRRWGKPWSSFPSILIWSASRILDPEGKTSSLPSHVSKHQFISRQEEADREACVWSSKFTS